MEHIMFVDDEPQIAELVSRMLQSQGYHVNAFTSSKEALAAFLADPDEYDLVITDQSMPGLTGYSLAQKILSCRQDAQIMMMTGFSESVTPDKARKAGIRSYIMKPFDVTELLTAVRDVTDNSVEQTI